MDALKEILKEIKAKTQLHLYTSIMLERNGNTKEAQKHINKAKGLNEAGKIIINQLQEV